MTSRTTSKTAKKNELPPAVRKQVERLLVEGMAYEDIGGFLAAQGYEIGKTELGRYGKKFLQMVQRVRISEEKARVLAAGVENGLAYDAMVSRMLLAMFLDLLLAGNMDPKVLPKVFSDFAKLQASNAAREKVLLDVRERAERSAGKVEKRVRKEGLSEAVAEAIRGEILGIAK